MTGPTDFNDMERAKGRAPIKDAIDAPLPPDQIAASKVIPLKGRPAPDPKNSTAPGFEKPLIHETPDDMPGIVDQYEDAILAFPGEPQCYQWGNVLARVVPRGPASPHEMSQPGNGLLIRPLSVPTVLEIMNRSATYLRQTRSRATGETGYRVSRAPREAAEALIARSSWRFQALTGIIEHPTLRPDLTVADTHGYDARTGLVLSFSGTEFPRIPPTPTPTEAAAGIKELSDLLEEFPFASEVDLSVALAMLLTGLVRKSLRGAPLFGLSATTMGSGKTLLGHLVSLLSYGRPASVLPPPSDPGEEQKVIFAQLLEGREIIFLDNFERQVASDALCAVLTSPTMSDRVLGQSKTAVASTAATMLVSGNNLVVAGDLSARTLICRLDAQCAHPEHRVFKRDLMSWVPQHRGRLVSAALTFLRGHAVSGEKPSMEPWGRFPCFDRVIRAALLWAGYPDPLLALRRGEAADPRRLEHQAVMDMWSEAFGAAQTTVRDAVQVGAARALAGDHRLQDAFLDVAGERGEINLRKLGRWLGKMDGRIQGGRRIVRGGIANGNQTWKVVPA